MEETQSVYTSVALWGSGETDPRSASALLNDFLPEKLGSVLRPETIGRGSLRAVINWFEGDDQLGEAGTVGSSDLVRDLLACRDTEGDEIVLIVLWPAVPAEGEISFAESAMASGIRVLDLCAALDELVITDEMREAAAPVPEKPKRLTKKQKEALAAQDGQVSEEERPKVADEISKEIEKAAGTVKEMESRREAEVVTKLEPWAEVGAPLEYIRKVVREEIERAFREFGFDKLRVHVGQEPWIEAPQAGASLEKSDMIEKLKDEVAWLRDAEKAKTKRGGAFSVQEPPVTGKLPDDYEDDGEPPFEGPYTDGKLEYYEYNGNWRRANGKPRRGEVSVWLTSAEVEAKRYEWSDIPD